jgi:hypothetical protein
MAKGSLIANILGGQILVRGGGLMKHWKFVLYVFVLIIIYVSFRFEVRDTMMEEVKNEEMLKDLRAEYSNKMTRMLQLSKRGEIEKRLSEHNSKLVPPPYPPTIISED